MKDKHTSTESVLSPAISTLQHLKKIAYLIDSRSYTKEVRRIALDVHLTVGLGRKLTGSVISAFLDFALVHGSEAHTRLSSFVKSDEDDKEVDTASSEAPPKHLHAELEIYCYFIVLLFLIDQKKYKEAKVCSSATIARLSRVNRGTVVLIASKLDVYYYLRNEVADDLTEIRITLLPLHHLPRLPKDEFGKMSSSQFPQSSTQCSDAQNQPENSREARSRWSATEDIVLISAWLNTSKDPIISNEQTGGSFWERIASYYASSEAVAGKPARRQSNCKQRWKKINEQCNKFVGCYSHASSMRRSGQSEDDVIQMAHQFYSSDHKTDFVLEHAWRKLRHEQKWLCSFGGTESSKRTKLSAGGAYSSSSNTSSRVEEEASRRPPGVKAAKRKAKKECP